MTLNTKEIPKIQIKMTKSRNHHMGDKATKHIKNTWKRQLNPEYKYTEKIITISLNND